MNKKILLAGLLVFIALNANAITNFDCYSSFKKSSAYAVTHFIK